MQNEHTTASPRPASGEIDRIGALARKAWARQDWATVDACAREIIRRDVRCAEGHFLSGLVCKAAQKPALATKAFETALNLDASRYDAAIELAGQHSIARRNAEAAELIGRYQEKLSNSPRYLDMAGTVYVEIGLPQRAWPLYCKANELQPGIDLFMANMASCAVYLGKISEARDLYTSLLEKRPDHQRNHYYLARLAKAEDENHIAQMKRVLDESKLAADKNVFLYYAIGKELEDLERWEEAFEYYKKAGDAVCGVAEYDAGTDIALIDKIIEVCNEDWLAAGASDSIEADPPRIPIFIVGLPRTGTTLTERIISSHSRVESVGETEFLQMVLRRESGIPSTEKMTPEMIEAVARTNIGAIARGYMDAVQYRLGDKPMFIDKLPFNFLYLGFIARAWPEARIVSLVRDPMDSCFSMYKQVFTWAYKFSYNLDTLADYYVAHDRLARHWKARLGDRLIEVSYEQLVADQETQTRLLLDRLGLEFEEACLNFDKNLAPTATASNVQVREKAHTRSVDKWRRFERQLQPLRERLEKAGIVIE